MKIRMSACVLVMGCILLKLGIIHQQAALVNLQKEADIYVSQAAPAHEIISSTDVQYTAGLRQNHGRKKR